jgi:subtilisin family serine protease
MKTNCSLWCACLAIFLFSCKKDFVQTEDRVVSADAQGNAVTASGYKFKPNEVLVKFKDGLQQDARNQVMGIVSAKVSRHLLSEAMQRFGDREGVYVLQVPGDVLTAVQKLKGLKELVYAEPNYIYQHDAVSNDLYFTNGSLWGMYGDASSPANQYGSQAAEAWANNHTGNARVVVGVIDEGAMYTHEDLVNNYRPNPFDPVDGVDNDGNGYIDDFHGWDFFEQNNSTYDGTGDDHGTHVSGTIGAKGGNNKGVAGMCWNVTLFSAKFLGPNGGTTDDAILSVDYMTDLKLRHNLRLVAVNNSWGGGGYSQGLRDAIARADSANILFVAAAGNYTQNTDVTPYYPGSYDNPNVITVASITKTGTISYFSNYGANNVDIGAPGSGVYSTVPGSGNTSKYASYDGTSMATPHVTGAAALYAATHPTANAATIKSAILSSAVPTPSLAGKCLTGGRLNASGF